MTDKPIKSFAELLNEIDSRDFEIVQLNEELDRILLQMTWAKFSLAYFKIANLGCEFIIKSDKLETQDELIATSILYNFKHGLEILLKMAIRLMHQESTVKINEPHNLISLFKTLENYVKKKSGKNSVPDELQKYIKQLTVLTRKYYYMDWINKYLIGNFHIVDNDNTLFRYPENGSNIVIDYNSIVSKFEKKDIETIRNDINKATDAVYAIFTILRKNK